MSGYRIGSARGATWATRATWATCRRAADWWVWLGLLALLLALRPALAQDGDAGAADAAGAAGEIVSVLGVAEVLRNGRWRAVGAGEKLAAAGPAAPEAHLALSWVQQAEFDLDGALASARRAVALDPDDPQALIQESRLLFGMGRTGEAAEVAETARQRAPDDALVHSTRGFLHLPPRTSTTPSARRASTAPSKRYGTCKNPST